MVCQFGRRWHTKFGVHSTPNFLECGVNDTIITTILTYGCRHSEACTVKMSETSRLHPLAVYIDVQDYKLHSTLRWQKHFTFLCAYAYSYVQEKN